jgi:uncharacterized protein YdeI (BOF family)
MKIQNRENLIFSYLALAFLVILVLTLVILAYLDNKDSDVIVTDDISEPIPKANVLTEDEMQAELNLLSQRADSPSKIVEFEVLSTDSNTTSTDSVAATSVTSENSVSGEGLETNSGSESYSYTPVFSVSEDQEVSEVLSFYGTIYNIQGDLVVLTDESGFIKVKVDSQTQITINGKNISLDSLKPAQKVHVEGVGNSAKRDLRANNLIVLAEFEVIPF